MMILVIQGGVGVQNRPKVDDVIYGPSLKGVSRKIEGEFRETFMGDSREAQGI